MKNKIDRGFAESILSCVQDKIDYARNYIDDECYVISYLELENIIFSFVEKDDLTKNENQQETKEGF